MIGIHYQVYLESIVSCLLERACATIQALLKIQSNTKIEVYSEVINCDRVGLAVLSHSKEVFKKGYSSRSGVELYNKSLHTLSESVTITDKERGELMKRVNLFVDYWVVYEHLQKKEKDS